MGACSLPKRRVYGSAFRFKSPRRPHFPIFTMTTMDESPPQYRRSLPPGIHLSDDELLTRDYTNDKPSISLTGMIPNAVGDITTPASGRGVQPADLRDLDARRRFGAFGKTFVELERLRQSQSASKSRIKPGDKVEKNRYAFGDDHESLYERSCVTRQFVTMYNVISSRFLLTDL